MLLTNDLINPNPGGPHGFDPRHMYGVTNQDVFRWPAIANGTDRMLLGMFITTLHMPGIPLLLWGEEQAFYVLDNTANNYVFGRQPMSSATAWQDHGCYHLISAQYFDWPVEAAKHGCMDDNVSLDHRDPASPVRNIIKSMYQMRENYPVLNDGWFLQQLSNQTKHVILPGSSDVPTEFGMWSTLRSRFSGIQNLDSHGKQGNQSVWLTYSNENTTIDYQFDCSNNDTNLNITALISPFDEGTTIKNLFFPYDEATLKGSARKLGIDGSTKANGCLNNLTLEAWGFKAWVPKDKWIGPRPMVTRFVPGHDARILSTVAPGKRESLSIEFHFSLEMDCDGITKKLKINSTTEDSSTPDIDAASVRCSKPMDTERPSLVGSVGTAWTWSAKLNNVANGIHRLTLDNIPSLDNSSNTGSVDHFLFRIGQSDNPIVFPRTANYTKALLHEDGQNRLFLSQKAAGSDMFRYSLNWGSSYSEWLPYQGGNISLERQPWSGTKAQEWSGEHVIAQYWSRMTGSSSHVQHGDLDDSTTPRRFPHLFWQGPYNQFGFDAGLNNEIKLDSSDGKWKFNFMTEWPSIAQVRRMTIHRIIQLISAPDKCLGDQSGRPTRSDRSTG